MIVNLCITWKSLCSSEESRILGSKNSSTLLRMSSDKNYYLVYSDDWLCLYMFFYCTFRVTDKQMNTKKHTEYSVLIYTKQIIYLVIFTSKWLRSDSVDKLPLIRRQRPPPHSYCTHVQHPWSQPRTWENCVGCMKLFFKSFYLFYGLNNIPYGHQRVYIKTLKR